MPLRIPLLIVLLLSLAACKVPTPPPSPTPWPSPTPVVKATGEPASPTPAAMPTVLPIVTLAPSPTRPVTSITVWENLPEAQAKLLAADIQAFQSEFPDYAVTLEHYDSPENFMAPLLSGETRFDVVLASPVLLSSLVAREQVAAIGNFFSPTFLDTFASATLQGASRDGQVWGLPDTAGFHLLLFYNRELVDRPPATNDELVKLARSLTGDGHWGLGFNSYDPLWLVPWLAPSGAWLTDENGQTTLATPAMETALSLYQGWQDPAKGIAPLATYDEVRAYFLAGRVAMMIDGEWAIVELDQTGKIDWGVALLPAVSQPAGPQPAAPLVLARYWAISGVATGNRALAAAAFLDYVTRPQRQLAWTSRFGLLPTRRQALDDPLILGDPAWRTSVEQMLAGRTVPLGTNANALLNAMREPLRAVLDGKLTPAQAAEAMQANAD